MQLGQTLSLEVLAALTALLSGNEACRRGFRRVLMPSLLRPPHAPTTRPNSRAWLIARPVQPCSESVGWGTLATALLRRAAPAPPSRALLLAVLALILEEEQRQPQQLEAAALAAAAAGEEEPAPAQGAAPRELFASSAIANWRAVPLFFELLRHAEREDQLWGLAAWQELLLLGGLPACLACDRAGLNRALISWLASEAAAADDDKAGGNGGAAATSHALQRQLAGVLRLTASFSCSGSDLRALLGLLLPRDCGGWLAAAAVAGRAPGVVLPTLPSHSLLLLQLLAGIAEHKGPTSFFSLEPPCSGLALQAGVRLSPRGYTAAAWLRLEDGRDAAEQLQGHGGGAEDAGQRVLLALLAHPPGDDALLATAEQQRGLVLCAGAGGELVLHSWGPRHAPLAPHAAAAVATAALGVTLPPRRWSHLALVHVPGALAGLQPPLLRIYVDGRELACAKVRYPAGPKEALRGVAIGAMPPRTADSGAAGGCADSAAATTAAAALVAGLGCPLAPLRGQMGAWTLFDGSLSQTQVQALVQLGPTFVQTAAGGTESSALLDQHPLAAATLLGSPPPKVCLSPQGQQLRGGAGGMGMLLLDCVGQLPAAALPGVQLCSTRQARDLLQSLGGVAVLLPLFALLDAPTAAPGSAQVVADVGAERPSPSRAPAALLLLAAMLRGSGANQVAFRCVSGPAIVAQLLERASPGHRSIELLRAAEQLVAAVGGPQPSDAARRLSRGGSLGSRGGGMAAGSGRASLEGGPRATAGSGGGGGGGGGAAPAASVALAHELMSALLLNLRLWGAAPPAAQLAAAEAVVRLAAEETALVRRLLPVPAVLDHLRSWSASCSRQAETAAALEKGAEPRDDDSPPPPPPPHAQPGTLPTARASELRRAWLAAARTLLEAAAAAGVVVLGDTSGSGGVTQQQLGAAAGVCDPAAFLADMQALLAFIDCPDAPLVQDVLSQARHCLCARRHPSALLHTSLLLAAWAASLLAGGDIATSLPTRVCRCWPRC